MSRAAVFGLLAAALAGQSLSAAVNNTLCEYRSAGDHPHKSVRLMLNHSDSRGEMQPLAKRLAEIAAPRLP